LTTTAGRRARYTLEQHKPECLAPEGYVLSPLSLNGSDDRPACAWIEVSRLQVEGGTVFSMLFARRLPALRQGR
jgi:hypothetical protein